MVYQESLVQILMLYSPRQDLGQGHVIWFHCLICSMESNIVICPPWLLGGLEEKVVITEEYISMH